MAVDYRISVIASTYFQVIVKIGHYQLSIEPYHSTTSFSQHTEEAPIPLKGPLLSAIHIHHHDELSKPLSSESIQDNAYVYEKPQGDENQERHDRREAVRAPASQSPELDLNYIDQGQHQEHGSADRPDPRRQHPDPQSLPIDPSDQFHRVVARRPRDPDSLIDKEGKNRNFIFFSHQHHWTLDVKASSVRRDRRPKSAEQEDGEPLPPA